MSRMVLPERTVDLWTAAYITKREPRARLWAPTERGQHEEYDLAAGLAEVARTAGASKWPNKVFVLENKGVRLHEGTTLRHRIPIRIEQLWEHLMTDAAVGGNVLYYLLPALAPPGKAPDSAWWGTPSAPAGRLPYAASRRVTSPRGPGFEDWAVVVRVLDLFCHLYQLRALHQTHFFLDPKDAWSIQGSASLKQFLTRVRQCKAGRRTQSLHKFFADLPADWADEETTHVAEEPPRSVRTFYAVGGEDEDKTEVT